MTVLLLALLFIDDCFSQTEMPPAAVETALATQKEVAPGVWAPGTVISQLDSKIASETSGVITFVVEVGDRLAKGDLLATVNDRELQLKRQHAEAEIKRYSAQLQHSQRQLERTEALSKTNNAAQSQLDELQMQRDVLTADLELAKIDLAQTQYDLERTQIRAPFAGIVAERYQRLGEHIASGGELLRLTSTDDLEVSVRAPIDVVRYINEGDSVPVKTKSESRQTEVRSIIPVGDERSRMVELRLFLGSSDWTIGEAVDARLNNGPSISSVIVPRDALVMRSDEVFLFKIVAEKAVKVVVKPGFGDAEEIAVLGNVEAGDVIVVRGSERLADGRPVTVLEDVVGS